MSSIKIEHATIEDAKAIVKVHYYAVNITCKPFYSELVLNNWASPNFDKKIKGISYAINNEDDIFLVAKDKEKIIGYGIIITTKSCLGAVYVHPSHGRKKIGTKILSELEKEAKQNKLKYLDLNASLNSVKFYTQNGYEYVEKSFHQLQSDLKMDCVKMRKLLR